MNRRHFLAASVSAAALASPLTALAGQGLSDRTRKLLRESLILDMTGANSPIHAISLTSVGYDISGLGGSGPVSTPHRRNWP